MKHLEYDLQVAICRYISYQYQDVLFISDTIANLNLTPTQANRNKKIQKTAFSTPDLLILEPRNGFSGLFIELKIETPFKKDGTIKASKDNRLENQLNAINTLNNKGYFCCFSWSFDMTKEIIDNYLNK